MISRKTGEESRLTSMMKLAIVDCKGHKQDNDQQRDDKLARSGGYSAMGAQQKEDSMLGSYRVLDLTDEQGFLCAKILGDLGADVILIEQPEGSPSRNIGPFYHDIPDLEKSLYWFAHNANKRGITLDIEKKDGQEIFKNLVKTSDIVIESFPVGYMAKLGLDYDSLCKVNPKILVCSITPFGQTGSYKDYKGSDLVCIAMSGYLYQCGDVDRPPVRISFPQAYNTAASEAAVAIMMALFHRENTGEGQSIDVSIQECHMIYGGLALVTWDFLKKNLPRAGSYYLSTISWTRTKLVWPCKDGYMSFFPLGGRLGERFMNELVRWMDEEGMADSFIKQVNWYDAFDISKVSQEMIDRISETIEKFFLTFTKAELVREGQNRGIQIFPVANMKDIVEYEQLAARNFWVTLKHPELNDSVIYPGPFVKASETPVTITRRAPLIGEHNQEVYREIGLSSQDLVMLKQSGTI